MADPVWQVVIADLRASRAIPGPERGRVDRALARAAASAHRRFEAHVRLGPDVLKGDELQCVLRAGAPALSFVTYLRARVALEAGARTELRAGIGAGSVARLSRRGPFASDGEAFHRARAALEAARATGGTRRTGWVAGDPLFDPLADAVLGLADAVMVRWTGPQWEAVAGRLEAKGLFAIARERGVAFQSVSKRLRAASWSEFQRAMEVLELTARAAIAVPEASRPSVRRSPSRG